MSGKIRRNRVGLVKNGNGGGALGPFVDGEVMHSSDANAQGQSMGLLAVKYTQWQPQTQFTEETFAASSFERGVAPAT